MDTKGEEGRSNKNKQRVSLDQLKDKLKENSLYIGRIPSKAKAKFKNMALNEFHDDYGMCLVHLLDRYTDNIIMLKMMEGVNDMHTRVHKIEEYLSSLDNKSDVKIIKTLSGKIIRSE